MTAKGKIDAIFIPRHTAAAMADILKVPQTSALGHEWSSTPAKRVS
jgi:hypothetical protein